MIRLLTVATLTIAALASGCAMTPGGMRGDPEAKRVYVLAVSYQAALKRLVDNWQECTFGPIVPIGQVINDVQHYPELRTASIVRGSSGFGTQIHQVIDLRELQPGQAELVVYAKASLERVASRTKGIADGSITGCP